MEERRKFNRWYIANGRTTVIECEGVKEKVAVLDVSAGGMKVFFSQPVNIGAIIYGKLDILSDIRPFFIKGKVTRVEEKDDRFETAIEFEQVTSLSIGH